MGPSPGLNPQPLLDAPPVNFVHVNTGGWRRLFIVVCFAGSRCRTGPDIWGVPTWCSRIWNKTTELVGMYLQRRGGGASWCGIPNDGKLRKNIPYKLQNQHSVHTSAMHYEAAGISTSSKSEHIGDSLCKVQRTLSQLSHKKVILQDRDGNRDRRVNTGTSDEVCMHIGRMICPHIPRCGQRRNMASHQGVKVYHGRETTYSMTSVPYEACVLGQSSTIDLQLWGFPFRQPLANLDITDGHGDFIRFSINGDQIAIYPKRLTKIRQ